MATKKDNEKLVPLTIRFTPETMDIINDLATQNGITKAEFVRLVITHRTLDYLNNIIYADDNDKKEIAAAVYELKTEMQLVRTELRRIGINYNQELKLQQIKNSKLSMYDKVKKEITIKDSCKQLDINEIEQLIERLEIAIDKGANEICRIVG